MNDDSGPTMECPWRRNVVPKIKTMTPMMIIIFPNFMNTLF